MKKIKLLLSLIVTIMIASSAWTSVQAQKTNKKDLGQLFYTPEATNLIINFERDGFLDTSYNIPVYRVIQGRKSSEIGKAKGYYKKQKISFEGFVGDHEANIFTELSDVSQPGQLGAIVKSKTLLLRDSSQRELAKYSYVATFVTDENSLDEFSGKLNTFNSTINYILTTDVGLTKAEKGRVPTIFVPTEEEYMKLRLVKEEMIRTREESNTGNFYYKDSIIFRGNYQAHRKGDVYDERLTFDGIEIAASKIKNYVRKDWKVVYIKTNVYEQSTFYENGFPTIVYQYLFSDKATYVNENADALPDYIIYGGKKYSPREWQEIKNNNLN